MGVRSCPLAGAWQKHDPNLALLLQTLLLQLSWAVRGDHGPQTELEIHTSQRPEHGV